MCIRSDNSYRSCSFVSSSSLWLLRTTRLVLEETEKKHSTIPIYIYSLSVARLFRPIPTTAAHPIASEISHKSTYTYFLRLFFCIFLLSLQHPRSLCRQSFSYQSGLCRWRTPVVFSGTIDLIFTETLPHYSRTYLYPFDMIFDRYITSMLELYKLQFIAVYIIYFNTTRKRTVETWKTASI